MAGVLALSVFCALAALATAQPRPPPSFPSNFSTQYSTAALVGPKSTTTSGSVWQLNTSSTYSIRAQQMVQGISTTIITVSNPATNMTHYISAYNIGGKIYCSTMDGPTPPEGPPSCPTPPVYVDSEQVNGILCDHWKMGNCIVPGANGTESYDLWWSDALSAPVVTLYVSVEGTITTNYTNWNNTPPDASLFQADPSWNCQPIPPGRRVTRLLRRVMRSVHRSHRRTLLPIWTRA